MWRVEHTSLFWKCHPPIHTSLSCKHHSNCKRRQIFAFLPSGCFHGWTYLVYTNRIRKKGRRRRQSQRKEDITKSQREKDSTRKEEHLVYTNNIRNTTGGKKKWQKIKREKEMAREVSREKVELHLLPKRKQAVCLLGVYCIASLAEQNNYSYILFATIFNLGLMLAA